MEDSQRNNANTKYLIAAIAVLTMLSAGLGYLYLGEKRLNEQKQSKIEQQIKDQIEATVQIDSLMREINLKITEVKKLGGDVSSLLAIRENLESDKKRLVQQKNVDIEAYELKIKNYQALLANKDLEIQKIKDENGLLTSQNESLSTENTGLKTEKMKLADSINAVTNKNKELAEKVTLAAALRAETINVYAISAKGKEKDGGNYKARRLDKIRISFHLMDNPLTKQEEKEIQIRILEPSGTIIADMATGSGIFTYNGKETVYTLKKREYYSNSHQLVEAVYARGQEYRQGKYTIELYCEGYKIGQGSFDVK
jgi:hypothetical protein